MANIVFSPALQAPINLAPPVAPLALVGQSSASNTQNVPVPSTAPMSLVGAAVRMTLGMVAQPSAAAYSGNSAGVISGLVTPRSPTVGAASLAGSAPSVTQQVGGLTAQQDWINRTTAAGVVQYVRFSGISALYSQNGIGTTIATNNTTGASVNTQQAGSSNVSSFIHQGDGTAVHASWNATGGIIGDGCLHIDVPTSSPAATAQWFIPLNAAWTANGGQTQGFGTGDFYIQFRAKFGPNWLSPSIGGGGKKTCIVGGLTFNSPGSSSSDINNEFVVTNDSYTAVATFYHHNTGQTLDNNPGGVWQPTAPAPYNQFGHFRQPALDNGSQYTNVAQRYSLYEQGSTPISPGCWYYREGQWFTVYIHIRVADWNNDGVANPSNFAELYVARDGDTSYTPLYSQTGFAQASDSTAPNGPQALWLLGYDTGRTQGLYPTWQEFDQIIVSTQPIACPQARAVAGANDGPSWVYTTIEGNTGQWLNPCNNATAIGNNRHWLGASAVLDPLANTTNLGNGPHEIIDDYCGMAVDWAAAKIRLLGNGGHSDYYGNEIYGVDLRQPTPQWYRARNATANPGGSGSVGPSWPDGTATPAHTYCYTIGADGHWWSFGRYGVPFVGYGVSGVLYEYVETDVTTTTPNTINTSGNYWVNHGNTAIPSLSADGGQLTIWDPALDQLVSICGGSNGGSNSPCAIYVNPTTGAINTKNTNSFANTNYTVGGFDTTNRVIIWSAENGNYFALNLGAVGSPTYNAIYSITMSGTIPASNAAFHWFPAGKCWLTYVPSQGLLKGVPTLSGSNYVSIAWSVSSLTLTGTAPGSAPAAGLYGLVQIIPNIGDGRSALVTMPHWGSPDLFVLPLPRVATAI